jgi:transcriptional regulator with XRE-family HTH domain
MSQENMKVENHQKIADAHSLFDDLVPIDQESCCGEEEMIGARLRQLRKGQKISIRTLAARCGISVNTLSLIEHDRTSPNLRTLKLLADGLGIPLVTFFEPDKPEYVLVHQQQGQRTQLRFANGTLEKLGEGLPPLGAEPILVTLDPDQDEAGDISHVGREFIYCLEGKVVCVVANQEYPLSTGDSLLFDARAPHHWVNAEPEPARLLVLFCPMEAHDLPAERHLGE